MEAQKHKLRDARDSLIDVLFYPMQATYPIPDLPVSAENPKVLHDVSARLVIPFTQSDVTYEVRDQTGNKSIKKIVRNNNEVIIETRPLTGDEYTFRIIAAKKTGGLTKQLLQPVIIKAGVNTALEVQLKEPVFEFGSHASIIVKDTQPRANYQLYDKQQNALSELVYTEKGGDIELVTTEPVTEDIVAIVWATSSKVDSWEEMLTKPEILVFPDTSIVPALREEAIDYNEKATIVLNNTQKSAEYKIVFEDIDDDAVDKSLLIDTTIGEPVKGNGKTLQLPVEGLKEDLTISVVATKIKSGHSKKLPVKVFIPVRPDPGKTITVIQKRAVNAGESATIKVANTQRGVIYHLENASTRQNIGLPQYHHKNYGVGRARVGIEYSIDYFNQEYVELETGPLHASTTFNIIATKATTKQTALVGTIAVEVK